jgi:heme A synthase
LSTILLLHDRLALSVVLFMVAVGLWGMFTFFTGGGLSGSLTGALLIGQVLVIIQGLLGLALVIDGFRPISSVHYLYGITAAIALPFIFTYTKDRHPRQTLVMFSLGALFIAGLAVRGMTTGS